MFTGIIETIGEIQEISESGSNRQFWISSPLSHELHIDQSLCHDGVCLTVDQLGENRHRVTAVDETLKKTNLSTWGQGKKLNLERCVSLNGRLDGHLVQGHTDTTGECVKKEALDGSWLFRFGFNKKFAPLLIEKGSISLNGVSLTVFDLGRKYFSVAIIPYTYENTNLKYIEVTDIVNLEFDVIGKYILRGSSLKLR